VVEALRAAPDFTTAARALERCAGGPAWLASWNDFVARHGHHTRAEMDVAVARWSETPDYLLRLVQAYLMPGDDVDPLGRHERSRALQQQLVGSCRQRLRNPIKRWLFGWFVRLAQQAQAVRENLKSEGVRRVDLLRRAALEAGNRLVRRAQLASREQIFMLTFEEIEPVLCGQLSDLSTLVEARRLDHARHLTSTPPPVIVNAYIPGEMAAARPAAPAVEWHGLAASPGCARGRARVVLRADAQVQVLPGEILVAPFTDPGWTPYFMTAAAIVMDVGGLLSHGAIVARELGIPAVVNVGAATSSIRDGQPLEVDGTAGVVRVLD